MCNFIEFLFKTWNFCYFSKTGLEKHPKYDRILGVFRVYVFLVRLGGNLEGPKVPS
jgi:hypothetical protein